MRIVQDTALPLSMSPRNTPSQRPKIPGMTLVAERPHNKHGSSVFVRDGLKVNSISVCEEENVEIITVELLCTNHHRNNSNSFHWDKESNLTS